MMRLRLPILLTLGIAATIAHGAPEPHAGCARVLRALEPGQALRPGDTEPALCSGQLDRRALHHDAVHRVTRARVALAVGDIVPAAAPASLARHAAGDPVVVRARVGVVQVERSARVVAPAPASTRVLVRADDGSVFAVDRADVGVQR